MVSSNKSPEGEGFRKLKKLGMEFEDPQDEYSSQPDSGSVIGGTRGKQEYGIDSDAELSNSESRHNPGRIIQSSESDISPEEYAKATSLSDSELFNLITDRLNKHPKLEKFDLKLQVENRVVTISGAVNSEADKLLAQEMVEACLVSGVDNRIRVSKE